MMKKLFWLLFFVDNFCQAFIYKEPIVYGEPLSLNQEPVTFGEPLATDTEPISVGEPFSIFQSPNQDI